MSTQVAQGEKAWCAKCNHFQLYANQACEKCGASMLGAKPFLTEFPKAAGVATAKPSGFWHYIAHGEPNPHLICPHCQTKGSVHTTQTWVKAGLSGGKATAALLTGGLSLLATGLSRKQQVTQAWCGECRSEWQF